MENLNLVESFAEFKEFKNIDRATLMSVLEDIFRNMLLKNMEQTKILTLSLILTKETWKSGETGQLLKTKIYRIRIRKSL